LGMEGEGLEKRRRKLSDSAIAGPKEVSNSRLAIIFLYDLCRKALSEPFRAPFVAFDALCTARIEARRDPQQLLASTWIELRHGDGTRGQAGMEVKGSLTRIDGQGGS
jgi:hypothetical protein